jgi:DNA-binding IclR family transcriptional regulator
MGAIIALASSVVDSMAVYAVRYTVHYARIRGPLQCTAVGRHVLYFLKEQELERIVDD